MEKIFYSLPSLDYGYDGLEPFISQKQLQLHHQKHHQAYIDNANKILDKMDEARQEGNELDMKATIKSLVYNTAGHMLHSLFWKNMAAASGQAGSEPQAELKSALEKEFGSVERFKQEFSQTASSVEGSGWAALVWEPLAKKLLLAQIEKHHLGLYPGLSLLLVLDVWEHAYYLDYQNGRSKFIDAFWQIVNWEEVGRRLKRAG